MPKQQRKIGMVVRIPTNTKQDAFAQVLSSPEIAVLNLFRPHEECPSMSDLETAELLFRIWVMNSAITSGHWGKICTMAIRPEFTRPIPRFKRDPIDGRFSIYLEGLDRPTTPVECVGLEPASVWSAEHVEARLRDHLQGRRHKPLDVLLEGIPNGN